MEIIDFPYRNGLLRLGNSYENIEWGPEKIRVFKMSPILVCIYVYMSVCAYTCMYVYMSICLYVYMSICVDV